MESEHLLQLFLYNASLRSIRLYIDIYSKHKVYIHVKIYITKLENMTSKLVNVLTNQMFSIFCTLFTLYKLQVTSKPKGLGYTKLRNYITYM